MRPSTWLATFACIAIVACTSPPVTDGVESQENDNVRLVESGPIHPLETMASQASPGSLPTTEDFSSFEPSDDSREGERAAGSMKKAVAIPPLGQWQSSYGATGYVEIRGKRHELPSTMDVFWLRRPHIARLYGEGQLEDGNAYHVAFELDFINESGIELEGIWIAHPTGHGTSVTRGFLLDSFVRFFELAKGATEQRVAKSGNERFDFQISRLEESKWRITLQDADSDSVLWLEFETSTIAPPWEEIKLKFRSGSSVQGEALLTGTGEGP